MTQEGLEQEVNRIGYMLQRAHADMGVKTTLVLVIEQPDGKGLVTAFENGDLKEAPMEIAMTAADAADKAQRFAVGSAVQKMRG